jgi:predicted helicase
MNACAIKEYIAEIDTIRRKDGDSGKSNYRSALKTLLEKTAGGLVTMTAPEVVACGAPDFIIVRNGVPLGYIAAQNANWDQISRLKKALHNFIITDYLNFELFADNKSRAKAVLTPESNGGVTADAAQIAALSALMEKFAGYSGKSIGKPTQLARKMADMAKLLVEVIKAALEKGNAEKSTLAGQLEDFRNTLIRHSSAEDFANMYAQTAVCGLFAARLNQENGEPFIRENIMNFIPRSNPFLYAFFQHIADVDLDAHIKWVIDALAGVFDRVSVADMLKEFAKANQDPYIHFYETFLAKYDPAMREKQGVYYTPAPVVQFIVQAVDDILVKDFDLPRGLADDSKTEDGKSYKVSILDPAAGTGIFLAEVIEKIHSRFVGSRDLWNAYCRDRLIPRLNGFEILIAPYAAAHFKLDMQLRATGYQGNDRLRVYLTNSLEETTAFAPNLPFTQRLTDEAKEADALKEQVPIMVTLGNPPYSGGGSANIKEDFLADYKKEPGGKEKLKEKNIKIINDDYVKFIHLGQRVIERNNAGILAYINNHGFLSNITFRGMRWSLSQTFDKIFILDLRGNARKRESTPDNEKDENIFAIQQGVSVNIFIKTGNKKAGDSARVYFYGISGGRKEKYRFLLENTLDSIRWEEIYPRPPYYFFTPEKFGVYKKNGKNEKSEKDGEYESGFGIPELFPAYSSGIMTHDDSHLVSFSPFSNFLEKNQKYLYRPFDTRYINYDLKKIERPRYEIMRHFLQGENIALIAPRQAVTGKYGIFISNALNDFNYTGVAAQFGAGLTFPLYLYPDKNDIDKTEKRRPNLNAEIIEKIAGIIRLSFIDEKNEDEKTFAPIDIFDYIYAVLHSPAYREKYKEFLKIDFPRVPYPADSGQFRALADLGASLRALHLLENIEPSSELALFPVEGDNAIEKAEYQDGKVRINNRQYFENVPLEAWEFSIGGYQPAQKWLKDRKDRVLSFEDIRHYQKIVNALYLTRSIQTRIDSYLYPR